MPEALAWVTFAIASSGFAFVSGIRWERRGKVDGIMECDDCGMKRLCSKTEGKWLCRRCKLRLLQKTIGVIDE